MSEQKYIRVEGVRNLIAEALAATQFTDWYPGEKCWEIFTSRIDKLSTYTPADILAGCVVDYQTRKPKHEGTYLVYNKNEEMWHEAHFHKDVEDNGEFGWLQAQYVDGVYIGEEFYPWDGIVCWLDCPLPQPPKEDTP